MEFRTTKFSAKVDNQELVMYIAKNYKIKSVKLDSERDNVVFDMENIDDLILDPKITELSRKGSASSGIF